MITNIIDHRKRPHRWKRVNVVMEDTWNDNSCSDADQATRPQPAHSVLCETRANISLTVAIEWGSAQQGDVTLYIYDEGEGFDD